MKKTIAVILAAMLAAASLSGCYGLGFLQDFLADDEEAYEDMTVDIPGTFPEIDDYPKNTIPVPELTELQTAPAVQEVNVRPAEWASVQWEPYSSPYFTLNIPSGWQVEWQGDANQLAWRAVSPDGKIGFFNQDHAYAAKDASMASALGFSMSLSEGTVQEYFETMYKDTTDYFSVQNSCVPGNKDVIQAIRPYTAIRDYQALYATFKENGWEGEGVYSAVIMDSKDVVVRGANYGAWEINCICTQWAPAGTLVNWAPVIDTIAKSFQYTDLYIQQWQQIAQSVTEPKSTVSDNDPVMEAFEERSKSDTIIQEKRSDMLEEYERVYDNNTGEIYRAYNGFLDDMGDQNRYTPITDNQYTEGYVGWIDK